MGLSWRISNTLDADFCVEALNEAIYRIGPPDIMNSDQRSRFTTVASTNRLRRSNVRISMDGRGRYLDNIFPSHGLHANHCCAVIEWLWRSLKQETVYLHEITDGFQAIRIIDILRPSRDMKGGMKRNKMRPSQAAKLP